MMPPISATSISALTRMLHAAARELFEELGSIDLVFHLVHSDGVRVVICPDANSKRDKQRTIEAINELCYESPTYAVISCCEAWMSIARDQDELDGLTARANDLGGVAHLDEDERQEVITTTLWTERKQTTIASPIRRMPDGIVLLDNADEWDSRPESENGSLFDFGPLEPLAC